jgi:vacuolar protein sorting-associated protein 29
LASVSRQLDCDVLISGHTHTSSITQYDGKYFINPGSVTGAYSPLTGQTKPSFILVAIQGDDIVAFIYELINDEVQIKTLEFTLKK